ncbi:MAG: hypothetical protein HY917_04130 [Candidatus Diapherotrites archaeon]|nr:hypothetical protein [Candidatus Diapherotrites archaeon]
MEEEIDFLRPPTEEMRLKLLQEEFKLRKKQPEAWTKSKFRPYANFRSKRLEKLVVEEA